MWNRPARSATARELEIEAKESAIRQLDLRSSLEYYGVEFNMRGAALCPFHNEKTASFRIMHGSKRQYWHCFGCGETGELIKFVRKRFGMNYYGALDAICRDFGIGSVKLTPTDLERLDSARIQRYNAIHRYEELVETRMICEDMYQLAWDTLKYIEQFYGKSLDNERYVTACFAVLQARNSAEKALTDCVQYLNEHPEATPQVRTQHPDPKRCVLPKAPLWRDKMTRAGPPESITDER